MKISLYLDMANQIADTCSGCLRRKVGAIAISDTGQIIGAGYNTALSGYGNPKKCESCVRQDMNIPSGERHEICNALHAEQMVICNAADRGISLKGSTLVITCSPCIICAKMIVGVGFDTIYYASKYPDDTAITMLKEAGVKVNKVNYKSFEEYCVW